MIPAPTSPRSADPIGTLRIDNNLIEDPTRPDVVGRKKFLFCDTVAGAKACANFFSLLQAAKANGLNPNPHMRRVCTELWNAETVEDVEALLPLPPKRPRQQAA